MPVSHSRLGIHTAGSATPASGSVNLIAPNPNRRVLVLQSEATGFYYGFGTATITTANGLWLAGGTSTITYHDYVGPVRVVTGSGTVTFRYTELTI